MDYLMRLHQYERNISQ